MLRSTTSSKLLIQRVLDVVLDILDLVLKVVHGRARLIAHDLDLHARHQAADRRKTCQHGVEQQQRTAGDRANGQRNFDQRLAFGVTDDEAANVAFLDQFLDTFDELIARNFLLLSEIAIRLILWGRRHVVLVGHESRAPSWIDRLSDAAVNWLYVRRWSKVAYFILHYTQTKPKLLFRLQGKARL